MNFIRGWIEKNKIFPIDIVDIRIYDVIDIIIVAYLIYKLLVWIKETRAWTLFKGILIILIFAAVAFFLHLNTIVWIFSNTISVGIIAVIVVFQPELRRALEQLGRSKLFSKFTIFQELDYENDVISVHTVDAIVSAIKEMSKAKTGALIVIQQEVKLGEYEKTGIKIDAEISSQLLVNIFEHNTPLHDGAIMINENRISYATCYLPLSENTRISKHLGTRHRAAIGISEVSDAVIVVVSEETGAISIVKEADISYNLNTDTVKNILIGLTKSKSNIKKITLWKGKNKDEKKISE